MSFTLLTASDIDQLCDRLASMGLSVTWSTVCALYELEQLHGEAEVTPEDLLAYDLEL